MADALSKYIEDALDFVTPLLPLIFLPVIFGAVVRLLRDLLGDMYSGSIFIDLFSFIWAKIKSLSVRIWRYVLPLLYRIREHFLVQEVSSDE